MSGERPDARELLEVAREALLEQVLPELSGDARYQGLMIANAMAIALRELAAGAQDAHAELQLLRGLYTAGAADGDAAQQDLEQLQARLARDLRRGELDGGAQLGVRRLLREHIESRVRVSNPRRVQRPASQPRHADPPELSMLGGDTTGDGTP